MALLPRFSIRQMLLGMVAMAIVAACLAGAVRGSRIAMGLLIGLAGLSIPLVLGSLLYWLLYGLAWLFWGRHAPRLILFVLVSVVGSGLLAQKPLVPNGVRGYEVQVSHPPLRVHDGYVPVRVRIKTAPVRRSTEDDLFSIHIDSNSYRGQERSFSKQVVLPAGKSETITELYLPVSDNQGYYGSCQIMIERGVGNRRFESGRDLLLAEFDVLEGYGYEQRPPVLLVSSAVVSTSTREWVCYRDQIKEVAATGLSLKGAVPSLESFVEAYETSGLPIQATVSTANTPQAAITTNDCLGACTLEQLPEYWVGLSGVEQILISHADLKNVAAKHADRLESLSKWVAAGGTLVVFDLGESYRSADEIFPTLVDHGADPDFAPTWLEPRVRLLKFESFIRAGLNRRWGRDHYSYDNQSAWTSLKDLDGDWTQDVWKQHLSPNGIASTVPFIGTRHVQGHVFAVRDNMQQWSLHQWRNLQNGVGLLQERVRRYDEKMSDYVWGFRVPGVGEPPVMAFQVLIGLFIVVAGPVMVIVLRRTGRMQLLFFLVPIISLIGCLGLVGYAVFVDGFDAWGRVHSITWLDQRTCAAATAARTAYYCGARPGHYQYDLQTVARFPRLDERNRSEDVVQAEGKMIFSGGEIRARTPHQVTTKRSYQSNARLVVRQRDDGKVVFFNRLGADVRIVIAKTDVGLFVVENLGVGEQSEATLVSEDDESEVNGRLRDLVQSISSMRDDASNRHNAWQQSLVQGLHDGSGIQQVLSDPQTYIAILETFPDVASQIEDVNYKQQFHVIYGNW